MMFSFGLSAIRCLQLWSIDSRAATNGVLVLLWVVISSACSSENPGGWCETEGARMLRERSIPTAKYTTIDDMLLGLDQGEVVLFAHRGGFACEELDGAPENSIPNMEKAIRMGFDGYETDLWRTSDGEYVIHHDITLDRTTTGTGNVPDSTLEQLRRLRLKYPSGRVSSEPVPTLREILLAADGRMLFLLQLKERTRDHFPEIVQIVKETESIGQVLFWVTWSRKYMQLFEQHLKSGIEEVRTSVVWRVRSASQFQDITSRYDPIMIDLVPSRNELRWERFLLHMIPSGHRDLVEQVVPKFNRVMVSRLTSNSYLDVLHNRGVRVFMSRNAERQLLHLVERGLHP